MALDPPAAEPGRPFRLARRFLWASLAGAAVVTAALTWLCLTLPGAPAHAASGGASGAVIDWPADEAALVAAWRRSTAVILGLVLAALGGLSAFQFRLVRQADRLLAAQEVDRLRHEAQMRFHAHHDHLTGLPNRASFTRRLAEVLAQAGRRQRHGGLLFIDVDGFEQLNDSRGHDTGDALLKQVSHRVGACLREGDLLFHMGGDEFGVIVGEIESAQDLARIAGRIVAELGRPTPLGDDEVPVGASIGIALFPDDGETPQVLLRHADAAMVRAQQAGRGRYAFFRDEASQAA